MVFLNNREELKNFLKNDETLAAAELKWAFFCSALNSFKRDFLLRPFPPQFKNGDTKNFSELTKVVNNIGYLKTLDVSKLASLEVDLLCWVFEDRNSSLKRVSKTKFSELKTLAKQQGNALEPDFVYELEYDENSNTNFEGKNLLFAYHGSQLANFHSILFNGLRSNLNKTSAFGEGTYLSSELDVSLNWSPMARHGAAASSLGTRVGCVAFCQVIDDPTGVRYKVDDQPTSVGASLTLTKMNNVPEKYFLVQNDSLVRVKYFLVYGERNPQDFSPQARRASQFLWQYRFWLMMLTYFVVLLAVGLANSSDFKWYIRRWSTLGEQDFQAFDET